MLDYYSQFPPPTKDDSVAYVTNILYQEFERFGIDEKDIQTLVSKEYDGMDTRGSQAAWMAYISQRLIANTRIQIKNVFKID